MTGRTIAHYELLEKLGEGGMGVVFKARDAHLDRFVAIKLLPAEKVADPERKRRFVQEAKAASALNHPNIVTIHDIGHADGIDYIAMEFIAGRTLDQLIGRKGLKLADALHYAIQISDALAKTHSAGIVHRDLKPSNLMADEDGRVKVLDFGLAKLTEPVAQASACEDQPTRTGRPETGEGTIVGTVAYMSPEQAEGKPVDARSDIFSFGSVLYEMLTGQRAFHGESKISTLSAILHQDPKPASELSAALPREVERVLNRCLRKDPQRRWQTMSDLKIALQDVKEESDSGKLAGPAPRKAPSRHWWWVAGAAILVVAVAAGLAWRHLRPAPAALNLATVRVTFDSGLTAYPALSADGKLIAYASDRSGEGHLDIYVQHASGGQPSRLTTNPADDTTPSFAPDGSRIAFRSERQGGGIWVVDVLGGVERKLVDGGWGPKYSPDGSTIAYLQESQSLDPFERKMFLIPVQGGQPRQILQRFGILSQRYGAPMRWSPDGKYLLFAGSRAGQPAAPDWWVAPIDGGPPVATGAVKALATTLPQQFPLAWFDRHVYFSRGSLVEGIHLFRAPIESGSWQVSGAVQRLTSGGGSTFSASFAADGSLLFDIANPEVQFFSLPLDAKTGAVSGAPVKVTSDAAIKGAASLSEDGRSLAYTAFASWEARRIELRVRNLVTGKESYYSSNSFTLDLAPQLSPDGSLVAYVDSAGGKPTAFVGPAESLPGRPVCEDCEAMGFFPGSRQILLRYGATRLVRQDLDTGAQSPVLELRRGALHGVRESLLNSVRLAPDGRRIAFVVALPGGSVRMFVAPVKDAPSSEQEWISVLPEGEYGVSPTWSADGGMLYYLGRRDGHLCVWARRLSAGTGRPAGEPVAIHHLHQPGGSSGRWGSLRFVMSARDRLAYPVWTLTSNLWRTKVEKP